MKYQPAWRRYLRFWGKNIPQDVDDELRFHIEMRVNEYVARGMTPDDARRLATQRFGDAGGARDSCVNIQKTHARSEGRTEFGVMLAQDLTFAARVLRRQTLPTIVAATCVALGIGATTAMFSIGNTMLLRPLPYPNGDRLVSIGSVRDGARNSGATVSSFPDLLDWRARQRAFTRIAATYRADFTVASGQPIRVTGAAVTANLFATLGTGAEVGRVFQDAEDAPGAPAVAIVSHGFAVRHLGGVESLIGQRIRIAGARRTIVGVIPDRWAYPVGAEIWLPLARDPLRSSRGDRNLEVIAELRAGMTIAAANQDMTSVGVQLGREYPRENGTTMPVVEPLREHFVGAARPGLIALGAATLLILLVGCANVAALQLARATSRAREIAVRAAIGAGRARIVGQLLTESALLALVGGAAGLGLAYAARNVIARAIAQNAPPWMTFDIDLRALGFAMLASMLAAIVFGLAPALRLTRLDPVATLHGGHSSVDDRGRLQGFFVVLEIALSLVLLVGAGFAIQSLLRLRSVPLGFDPERVAMFRVAMQGQRYDSPAERARVVAALGERVAAIPGVESAAATTYAPVAGCCSQFGTNIAGQPAPPGKGLMVTGNMVIPGFFRTLQIPLISGRDFTNADDANAPRVVIINETFAKRYWPAGDVLGHLIDTGGGMAAIIGIVGDIKQGRLIDAPEPQFYRAYAQDPWATVTFVVRARGGNVLRFAGDIRQAARDLDPIALPVSRLSTLQERIDTSIATNRVLGRLLAAFAAMALALAGIGVYALMSFFVTRRTRELGLRMALGAAPQRVLILVLRQAGALAAVGGVVGLAAGALAARGLSHFLYGVSAAEPTIYVAAAATLVTSALLASAGPARRASTVDPMVALRAE
ncbi:MAG: ABC transporter permease [bacterium]